jgi:hypothetical protein
VARRRLPNSIPMCATCKVKEQTSGSYCRDCKHKHYERWIGRKVRQRQSHPTVEILERLLNGEKRVSIKCEGRSLQNCLITSAKYRGFRVETSQLGEWLSVGIKRGVRL